MMKRNAVLFILTMVLLGCGGSPPNPLPAAGFINQTQHSDIDLQTIWTQAQQSIEPHQLLVAAVPDVPSQLLFAATGEQRSNPTGMIACPSPCNVRYSTAYSFYQPELTKYAASWEFDGNNFDVILEYEFENHILNALGYDMTWR